MKKLISVGLVLIALSTVARLPVSYRCCSCQRHCGADYLIAFLIEGFKIDYAHPGCAGFEEVSFDS